MSAGAPLPDRRRVTLVLVDDDGDVRGATAPFEVETPWWQDMSPVIRRYPSVTVLRLLQVLASPGATCGGEVTYLAEGGAGVRLEDWAGDRGLLADHPLRMPWARPGGPARALAWAAGVVELTGPPAQQRTWNLSCIWALPTSEGRAWLKCVPPFFEHEASVLRLLDDQRVPRLLASDGHRLLMAELPGVDGYEATLAERCQLVDELVELQLTSTTRLSALAAAGVPGRDWATVLARAVDLVARRAPGDGRLAELLEAAPDQVTALAGCGVPTVLVHGDAHPGNARVGLERGIWFDWGDCRIGDAIQDLGVLSRPGLDPTGELLAHWVAAWRSAVPGADPLRALELARPLLELVAADVYQGFLDHIEPSERVYHDRDVPAALAAAASRFASSRK